MKRVKKKCKWFWNLACCMLFYLLFNTFLFIFVKEFGLWVALALTSISYPIIVLVIATILRMRGDITERSFIGLVFEGFKITHLLQKIQNDSASAKTHPIFRSKKSR